MRIEDLDCFKDIPKEKMKYTLDQIKNPYFFKVGKYIVKSTFSEDSGITIGGCIKGLLML